MADASVLTAVFLAADPHEPVAREWLSRQLGARQNIHVPGIVLAEVAGAVRRRTGQARDAELSLRQLLQLPVLVIHDVGSELAQASAVVAVEARLKGCDAVYVALAAQLGEPLVTLDAEQLERAGSVVTVGRPGEENVR